ncbi:MAG: sensor histidine kinase [Phycisphaerales bacterium]
MHLRRDGDDTPFEQMMRVDGLSEPRATLDALMTDSSSMPWPARRELARSLADHLRSELVPGWVVPVVVVLADDAKPEVRQAIASLLHLVDDATFARLGSVLLEDSNAFVRSAAERSLARRRRSQKKSEREQQQVDHIRAEYAAIERLHGTLAAERAQTMAERFADVVVGMTAHNLGGVMTSLKLKADALQNALGTQEPDQARAVGAADAMVERILFLERLLRDMSEYARPLSTDRRRERLATLIADAHRLAKDAVEDSLAAGVEYECDVPESTTVVVVRHQIVMAFANVLKNAYEAIEPGDGIRGTVTVCASVERNAAVVVVADSGQGLEPEDLRQLQEFVPGRTSKKNRGTGFGLPIARRSLAAHGGSIEIESVLGQGTTITVRIPLDMEETDLP